MMMTMANVMIAFDDEHEAYLRKLAQEKYAGKKGSLTTVVQEALDKMRAEERQKEITEFIELLRKGLKGKYKMYKTRDEIYD